jgi:lipopolysaccharide/colanic/teichoic acid biosynthesis glycosyltransferase
MLEHASASETTGIFPLAAGNQVAVQERPLAAGSELIKRGIDITVALVVLIVTAPVLLVAIVLICISSPGSPIFAHSRIGRHGKPFVLYKLRTMRLGLGAGSERLHIVYDSAVTGPVMKVQQDPRVFPIGRFLRKTSIDELPNLINVLRGEMSIVGPRPMQAIEIDYCQRRYGELVNLSRLAVKPGITCVWQISGRSELSFDDRVRLDIAYATTWTPLNDLKIICATVPAVLFSRGAY